MLDCNLVNDTKFTLSKTKYLIFIKSRFLSLFLHFNLQAFWTSCTVLLSHGDLWTCLCLCIPLQTVKKCFIFPCPLHVLTYTGHCLCGCPASQIYSFLLTSSHLNCPIVIYYNLLFAYVSLLRQIVYISNIPK